FSSRRRHTRFSRDWSSDVCSSDLYRPSAAMEAQGSLQRWAAAVACAQEPCLVIDADSVIVAASRACADLLICDTAAACGQRLRRSEERRVGKEGGAGGAPDGETAT